LENGRLLNYSFIIRQQERCLEELDLAGVSNVETSQIVRQCSEWAFRNAGILLKSEIRIYRQKKKIKKR
jgi:hypothetical protein